MVLWILPGWLRLRIRGSHPLRPAFPKPFSCPCQIPPAVRTPRCTHRGLGSSAFARRYLRNRCFFLFLALLRCFSSGGSLPYVMDWRMDDGISPAGFPHSDIPGSQFMCNSPRLFAAYHVFHRLPVPRHPPCALLCLTSPGPHGSFSAISGTTSRRIHAAASCPP